MFNYQYGLAEQPASIVATANGTSQIIPNPEGYLNQHQLGFQLSELFPATSSKSGLASIVTGIVASRDYKDKAIRFNNPCSRGSGVECLANAGGFFERFLASVSGNFAIAERNSVQQGIVTNQSFSQHYGPAGEIDFDPSSLFITGTSWKAAVVALKGISYDQKLFAPEELNCFNKDGDPSTTPGFCIKQFAAPRFAASMKAGAGTKIAFALIPSKVQFKAVDQFDFLKNGGLLVPVPALQRSLKSYTLTWDVKRWIPSTEDRLAILAAYKSYEPPSPKASKVSQPKLCITILGGVRGYLPVPDNFTAEECSDLAHIAKADHYALGCANTAGVAIGKQNELAAPTPNYPDSQDCNWLQ